MTPMNDEIEERARQDELSEGAKVLAEARERQAKRDAIDDAQPRTDYDALNKMVRRQRSALTRAVNSDDPERVVLACRDAVREWDQPGAMWPDDWSNWQRALDDALPYGRSVDLRDLR